MADSNDAQHFRFCRVESNRCRRGFFLRKAALRYARQCP
jgi:hypothetical protein